MIAKGRKISVAGKPYQWKLVPDKTGILSLLVVPNTAGEFRALQVTWKPKPEFADYYGLDMAMTPGTVAKVIQASLAQGWNPASRGPVFRLPESFDLDQYFTVA